MLLVALYHRTQFCQIDFQNSQTFKPGFKPTPAAGDMLLVSYLKQKIESIFIIR